MLSKFQQYYYTLRYLKPVQFYGRLWFRLYKPKPELCAALSLRSVSGQWIAPVEKNPSLVEPLRFRFLGKEQVLECSSDWNHPDWEKIWLYNLHYFDDLNAEGAAGRTEWHVELIERWVEENPPGNGNGWEPYPTSLRIVNWVKWALSGYALSDKAVESLAVQTRLLEKRIEYHLLGNHLLANAKALVFAGLFYHGEEADRWLSKGLRIFLTQLPEQVLPDGGHFERSPMYHSIILDDLLDLINLLRGYGQTLPQAWLATAEKMLFWLCGMTHPDGEIALFNDAAFGIAPHPAQLFAYAERLGLNCEWNGQLEKGLTHFEQSGYLRWQSGGVVAVLDVAKIGPDYLPGHAHADTLSFELSLYDQRLFVNSGTSCYGVSDERLRQRSTAAHNTVEVDSESSSEVWGGFRVARRARPKNLTIYHQDDVLSVGCAHDGYERLPGKVTHHRQWDFNPSELVMTDSLSGKFSCGKARFYFYPDVSVRKVEDNWFVATLAVGKEVDIVFTGGADICLEDTTWHPSFGVSMQNKCLIVQLSDRELVTKINW